MLSQGTHPLCSSMLLTFQNPESETNIFWHSTSTDVLTPLLLTGSSTGIFASSHLYFFAILQQKFECLHSNLVLQASRPIILGENTCLRMACIWRVLELHVILLFKPTPSALASSKCDLPSRNTRNKIGLIAITGVVYSWLRLQRFVLYAIFFDIGGFTYIDCGCHCWLCIGSVGDAYIYTQIGRLWETRRCYPRLS